MLKLPSPLNVFLFATVFIFTTVLVGSTTWAQFDGAAKAKIETTEVAPNIYMLAGVGGNIGLMVSEDRVFMIDSQYAEASGKVMKAIKAITDKPINYMINTHWHGDHTGGNAKFGVAGAVILAHNNVRARLSSVQYSGVTKNEIPPAPTEALPSISFADEIHFYIGDIDVIAVHFPDAHTDGDVLVQFRGANVVHTGDLFFNGSFPFIDAGSGGSLGGLIDACELALARMNRSTVVIPGHGPQATRADFRSYLGMLKRVRRLIKKSIDSEKSKEEVLAENPLEPLMEEWGGGFLKTPDFTSMVYDLVKDEPKKRRSKSRKRGR